MKIAVASEGKEEGSEVSERAGRAPYILVFDGKGKLLEAVKNPFSMGGGGAGWGVARMLSERKAEVLVAGRFGENMLQALEERGIRGVVAKGKCSEAALKASDG